MVNTVRVYANRGRDVRPLTEDGSHVTGDIREISAFPFSLQLMFDQTLSNVIVCLMISHKKYKHKLHK